MQTATLTRTKPIMHVEVRLEHVENAFVRTDLVRIDITDWLVRKFKHLKIGQSITDYDDLRHARSITSITTTDCTGADPNTTFFALSDVTLDVQAYELRREGGDTSQSAKRLDDEGADDDSRIPSLLRVLDLPNVHIDGVWESLVFDKPIPSRLLQFLTRMVSLTKSAKLNGPFATWNRLILLHGEPGSGKTSLCRALAQKMTIRLGDHFSRGKLVEINASALLSKWFGESSKLISKMFDHIQNLAEDDATLVCVLCDEVESLTAAREKAVGGGECGDALRATNQLLTSLDRLCAYSNVVFLATSNLPNALDAAFLDRVDVREYIPLPTARVAYEILRTGFIQLANAGLIAGGRCDHETEHADALTKSSVDTTDTSVLPQLAEVHINLWNEPQSLGWRVWTIAEKCECLTSVQGRSGRHLRRLPIMALAMHTVSKPSLVEEVAAGLETVVSEQVPGVPESF